MLLLFILTIFFQIYSTHLYKPFAQFRQGNFLYPVFLLLTECLLHWFVISKVNCRKYMICTVLLHLLLVYLASAILLRPLFSFMNYFELRIIRCDSMLFKEKIIWLIKTWLRIDTFFIYGTVFATLLISLFRIKIFTESSGKKLLKEVNAK